MIIRSPFDIREQEFNKTTFEVPTEEKKPHHLFRCRLRECKLILSVQPCQWSSFLQCIFENCTIIVQKEWGGRCPNCRWIGCTFLGNFCSMSLGDRNLSLGPLHEELLEGPMILDCDFRQANLHSLALANADLKTIKFPKWPNVTILNPFQNKAELKSITFSPVPLQVWWFNALDTHPSISSWSINWEQVVAMNRKTELKLPGNQRVKLDPHDFEPYTDMFRSTMARLPYVIM